MVLLENDQFLSRLTLMFDKARTKGHVDLCMKRYDGRTKPVPREEKGGAPASSSTAAGANKNKNAPPQRKNRMSSSSSSQHDGSASSEYKCLVRASYRNEKITSIVHARDVNKFQLAYCGLLKGHMDGLKRQKKIKLKKATQ